MRIIARRIFESYMGLDCFTILYNYHTKDIDKAKELEPTIHKYDTVSVNEEELRLKDIDQIIDYENAFCNAIDASEDSIYTLCQIATIGYSLWDLLEDMIKHTLDNKCYTIGHKIIEYLDNDLTNEQIDNLNDLAKHDKETFEGIIGYNN